MFAKHLPPKFEAACLEFRASRANNRGRLRSRAKYDLDVLSDPGRKETAGKRGLPGVNTYMNTTGSDV